MDEEFSTRAVHEGYDCSDHQNAAAMPIYQTAAFGMVNADRGDALCAGTIDGYSYSRLANPTVSVLQNRIAALEGGKGAVAVGSGMAAVSFALLCAAEGGGRLIASSSLYGTSVDAMATFFPHFGVHTDFVDDINDLETVESLIGPDTRAIFTESVANPSTYIADIPGLAEVAHRHGVALIVDNTLPTPYLFNPIEFGADIVVHSTTKGISGHGNTLGGVIVDSGRFTWSRERYPQMHEPELVISDERNGRQRSFAGAFGTMAFLNRVHTKYLHTFGAVMGPFEAYLQLTGLETLPQRVRAEVETAEKMARHLTGLPHITQVNYSGLGLANRGSSANANTGTDTDTNTNTKTATNAASQPAQEPDSPGHRSQRSLARTLLPRGVGTVLSFKVEGGYERVRRIVDNVHVMTYMPNIGDNKTLIVDPARITHREVPAGYRRAAGVDDDLIRISVGLEGADDLIADLDQALATAYSE